MKSILSYFYKLVQRIGYAVLYILATIIVVGIIAAIACVMALVELIKYLFIHGNFKKLTSS